MRPRQRRTARTCSTSSMRRMTWHSSSQPSTSRHYNTTIARTSKVTCSRSATLSCDDSMPPRTRTSCRRPGKGSSPSPKLFAQGLTASWTVMAGSTPTHGTSNNYIDSIPNSFMKSYIDPCENTHLNLSSNVAQSSKCCMLPTQCRYPSNPS